MKRPLKILSWVLLFLGPSSVLGAAPLPQTTPHGILADRVVPFAHLEQLNGSPTAPAASLARWRQAVHELRRAAENDLAWPAPRKLQTKALRGGPDAEIPLAVVHARYDRLNVDGDVQADGVFALGVLREDLYHGAKVDFVLPPQFILEHGGQPLAHWTLDVADGRGPRPLTLGVPNSVSYATTGAKVITLTATTADGDVLTARGLLTVHRLATPAPTATWPLTATVPYAGATATGQAYLYLAPGHTVLTNPVIVVEGFDLDNSMDWPVLYDLLNQQNLLEDLRAAGFDAVVLDFTEATEPIQRNAQVLTALLDQVNATVAPGRTSVVIGASMGGLVARYALAWLEQNGVDHRVRAYLSFDSPHAGANIPLGVQHWLRFFQDESADAAFLLARLNTPAARQMLLYHESATSGTSAAAAPERATWLADLAGVGDWPTNTRRVAIANGSGNGANQGFAPGDQLIRYEYRSLLIDIDGNVWAVPDGGTGQMIFDGGINLIWPLPDTYETTTVAGTGPLDSAPGGYRNSMAQMDATNPSYGDIVALHDNHCFIPTVSALAIDDSDPYFAIAGNPDLMGHTPFDAVYWPGANQAHIAITPENRQWFLAEIAAGVAGTGPVPGIETAVLAPAAPNPFNPRTEIRFRLNRSSSVSLAIFDAAGRRVRNLIQTGRRAPGPHQAYWDGRDETGSGLASGIYFARLVTERETHTTKLTLVR